ncbi:MAG TPA: Gfo/Idh/MocA family oxidoreductase, partial [Solirubrobacteraceae bacterium]
MIPAERRASGGRRKTDPIPVGVIGAGNMGSHHVRTYGSLGGICELRGIYDLDTERCQAVAKQFGTHPFASVEEMLGQVRAVSICTPSALHVEHALLALRAGVDVLIEKPVALTVEHAQALRDTVAGCARRPVVQVGHIEHFNPAVREVAKLLEGERMVALELQRLSPFDGRIIDA